MHELLHQLNMKSAILATGNTDSGKGHSYFLNANAGSGKIIPSGPSKSGSFEYMHLSERIPFAQLHRIKQYFLNRTTKP